MALLNFRINKVDVDPGLRRANDIKEKRLWQAASIK